ncbi:hypothetical protein [Belliella pelovolcani]|uniref:HTH cro/C1-type domain-containing protein n=1 Tax=Belliella pelovolcani TaxID=529505 RepID=A0A1N7KEP2_9BACT|nr:hypothetical protein [Belliella pelovolcani]SIS59944.1 hypothetical protein SAMN05421761_10215 [Belliella pelovolcani]
MKEEDKKRTIKEVKFKEEFEEIGALFNQGSIKSLSRLHEIKPTNLSKELNMGYYTFLDKLSNPEKLSIEEIIKLSIVVGTDYRRILEVICVEIKSKFGL